MADWQTLARRAARSAGVPPDLFVALVRQESGGRNVTNPRSGATGPTQLMPGTARGLGVDPHNFQQNLLGGARYLKQQLHTFGGNVDKALAAYNAGPGAVQQYGGIPPYAETRNYVRSIKNMVGHPVTVGRTGATGSVSPVRTSISPAGPSALGLTADTSSGVDVSSLLTMLGQQQHRQAPTSGGLPAPAFTAQAAMPGGYQALASGGGPAPKQDLGALLSLVQTQGSTGQPTGTGAVSGAAPSLPAIQAPRGARGSGGGFKGSKVLELIYNDGGNGYGIKNGQVVNGPQVFSGVWAGHANHVHVAAGPNTVVQLGKLAQGMGLHVGENPHFGGVSPVHVGGSYHYKGEAIDVSGDPRKLSAFARRVETYNRTHRL